MNRWTPEYFSKRFPGGHPLVPDGSGPFDSPGELESFQRSFLDGTLVSSVYPIVPTHRFLSGNARGKLGRRQWRVQAKRDALLTCQVPKGFDCSFDASRPRVSAADAHAVAKIFSVGRENAARGDGDPVLVERLGGQGRGVEFRIKLDP